MAVEPTRDGPVVTYANALEAVRRVLPAKHRHSVELGPHIRLEEDLGLSSLDVGEVFVRLEQLVGRPLDTAVSEETKTIGDLTRVPEAPERPW